MLDAQPAGSANGWWIDDRAEPFVVRCNLLASCADVAHGFSTRRGSDGEEFDLAARPGVEVRLAGRLLHFGDRVGLDGSRFAVVRQVHGNIVVDASQATPAGWARVEADAVIARRALRVPSPAIRFADCVPILLADSAGRVTAAIHAGWRGTVRAVTSAAVARLVAVGTEPSDLFAAIGPAIGPCCYEVDPEVARQLQGDGAPPTPERSSKRPRVDLAAINRDQLLRAGLDPGRISIAPWCTRCTEALFYSHRRDGDAAGRHLACIGWIPQ